VPRTTGYRMTCNDSLDISHDLYSPVSPADYERAPFMFDGKLERVVVKYLPQK
jgi:arylsulfatase